MFSRTSTPLYAILIVTTWNNSPVTFHGASTLVDNVHLLNEGTKRSSKFVILIGFGNCNANFENNDRKCLKLYFFLSIDKYNVVSFSFKFNRNKSVDLKCHLKSSYY